MKKKTAKAEAKPSKAKPKSDQSAEAAPPSIQVRCSYSRMVAISELKPHPRNPNTHPDSQIKLLANIIAKTGWRSPIVVSKLSGFIVKGHGRLAAAMLLGEKFVPVDDQEYPDEAMEMSDLVADNQIASYAEMDRAMLKDILQDLDNGAMDMLLTGFDMSGIEALMTSLPPPDMIGILERNGMEAQDGRQVSGDEYAVTFVFQNETRDSVMNYLKRVGKGSVVEMIVKASKETAE